jgi:hypothetical protein
MPKIFAYALAKAPGAAIRIGWKWLRVKKKAQRAEKLFRKRLESAGMDREDARRLAESYASTAKLRKFMVGMGIPGRMFNGNGR